MAQFNTDVFTKGGDGGREGGREGKEEREVNEGRKVGANEMVTSVSQSTM